MSGMKYMLVVLRSYVDGCQSTFHSFDEAGLELIFPEMRSDTQKEYYPPNTLGHPFWREFVNTLVRQVPGAHPCCLVAAPIDGQCYCGWMVLVQVRDLW